MPVIKFCTTFYNEFPHTGAGQIGRNDPPLPIERMFDRLVSVSYEGHPVYNPDTPMYHTDAFSWKWWRCKSDFIDDGRNALVGDLQSECIYQKLPGPWTHIMFIDSDNSVEDLYGAVKQMLALSAPIVSGAYECKSKNRNIVAGDFVSDHEISFLPVDTTDRTVGWCGSGFILIAREVFEKMCYRWYRKQDVHFEDAGETKVRVLSEDVTFCLKARECGYEIKLLGGLKVHHHYSQGRQVDEKQELLARIGEMAMLRDKLSSGLQQTEEKYFAMVKSLGGIR